MSERYKGEFRVVSKRRYEDERDFRLPPRRIELDATYTLRMITRGKWKHFGQDSEWDITDFIDTPEGLFTWVKTTLNTDSSIQAWRLVQIDGILLRTEQNPTPHFDYPTPLTSPGETTEAGYIVGAEDSFELGLAEVAAGVGEIAMAGSR